MIDAFIVKVVGIIVGIVGAIFVSYTSVKKVATQKATIDQKDSQISDLQKQQQVQSKSAQEANDVQNKVITSSDDAVDDKLRSSWTRD
jgi:predicted histidine transporter YuiF (NhaC family)